MRILGFERGQGACNHYRIVQPLYKLMQNKLADILTIHPENAQDMDFVHQKILEAEIIMFQRPATEDWMNFIKVAQKAGKIIVVDFDDDPFNTSPWNPAYIHYGVMEHKYRFDDGHEDYLWKDGEGGFSIEDNIQRRDYFRACFKRADAVSCTTPILQETFSKLNKNTFVLPNLIDVDIYQKQDFNKKEIRIGWQGGASHYEDLYMVMPAIKLILKQHKNVKFVFFGDSRFYGLVKDIPRDQYEWHSWVHFKAYPYKLMLLNLDIGICPVKDSIFSRNKSAIKYFEYSAIQIPTVASDIPPYAPIISHGDNGLLTKNDTKSWVHYLDLLIRDKQRRKEMGRKAFAHVYENHNADKKAHLWTDAFGKLMKRDVAELVEV